MDSILLYIGGALTALWGIVHLFPTKNVVKGFGEISEDNKRIITMEWVSGGASLIFIGLLVVIVAILNPSCNAAAEAVYGLTVCILLILATISLFTGAKIDFLPYKLCPVIFTISAILIFIAGVI